MPDSTKWMRDKLFEYEAGYRKYWNSPANSQMRWGHQDELISLRPLVLRIIYEVSPDLLTTVKLSEDPREDLWRVNDLVLQASKYLSEREAIETFLETGPRLSSHSLHPWIWDAARYLWADGHRRAAIQQASSQLEAQLKVRAEKQGDASDVARQAFSVEPPTAKNPVRLRITRFQKGTDNWKSAHEGAKFLGSGIFMLIRNIRTHSTEEPGEQEGLEELAALSVLARLIDGADIERF